MAATNKDVVLVVSLVLSLVSLVLLFSVTWYFQLSLDLLQQQVEYDRELLLKLQEQVNSQPVVNYDNTINTHHDVKRQSGNDCHCKDGTPGPIGPPGEKGDQGTPGIPGPKGEHGSKGATGPRGDPGDRGQRGVIGDHGLPGSKGEDGTKGATGPRGDPGDRGPRGLIGDTGLRGPIGQPGEPGMKGAKGDQGDKGDPGPKGSTQLTYQAMKGEKGNDGLPGPKGEQGIPGSRGYTGNPGLTGPKGATGQKGVKGDKEERNGGTVYVRWGHDQCPSTAQLVYSGRAGGADRLQGGGTGPLCLPPNPNYLPSINGDQDRSYMHGAEYWTPTDSGSHIHGRLNHDVPCAVCYVSQRSSVYMVPAKTTCPNGWIQEYYGYLMSEYYKYNPSQYSCVDYAFKTVANTGADNDSMEFFFVEGVCGSLPCPPYENGKELSCTVCTK